MKSIIKLEMPETLQYLYLMGAIEKLIHQKKFGTERERAMISLIYTNNLINYAHTNAFKEFNLTPQQYNTLRILRGQHPKPATINLIKERMLDKNSDVSRIVERLRKAGWVKRLTCEKDRRAVDVLITEEGLAVLQKIDEEKGMMVEPLRGLSDADIQQLNELLDKLLSPYTE